MLPPGTEEPSMSEKRVRTSEAFLGLACLFESKCNLSMLQIVIYVGFALHHTCRAVSELDGRQKLHP